jgi:4-hydroxybenzoate polyprenyltransferase
MGKFILRYATVILVLGLAWKLAAAVLSSSILPPPELAVSAFAQAIKGWPFWMHFGASSLRVVVAMLLAWLVAFPLGILLGSRARLDAWLAPFIFLTYPIPKIVLLPVVLLVFGLGNASKVTLLGLITGYQIVVATRDGVLSIHHKYLDSVYSLGATGWQVVREVLLPAALPHGFTALRLGTGTSVAVLFFAESFATTEGLGYFIMDAWGKLAYVQMFVGIFGMSLLGVILYESANALERWCCAWKFIGLRAGRQEQPGKETGNQFMWVQQVQTYGRLIKFSHTIFALPFALAAVILAHGQHPVGAATLGWILLAMAGARSAAMGFNRLVDYRFDQFNPRTTDRPLVTGHISKAAVLVFIVLSSGAFVFAAAMLGRLCLALSVPVLLVLFSYSYTKRFTSLSHLYLGFAIGLAPVGAWIAVAGNLDPRILLLTLALITYIAGFDILYACQDIDFDRSVGLCSFPARWGAQRALQFSAGLHLLTFLALFAVYLVFDLGSVYLIILANIGLLLVLEHKLVQPQDLDRINLAFFHVNSAISILLLLAVLLDTWLA